MMQKKNQNNLSDMITLNRSEIQKADFYDKLFGVDTSAVLDGQETFDGKLFYRYQPTNYSFLEYIFKVYPFEDMDHIMDVGFGKGRVLFMASYMGCNRVSGCEINEEYFKVTSYNIKEYVSRTKSNTVFTLLNEDAQKIEIDNTINKFFFFNPFHLKVYVRFFENLMKSLSYFDRKTTIFLYSPLLSTLKYLDKLEVFHLVEKIDINAEHILLAVYQN